MARLVTPVFLRQGGGAIVNISSLWAVEPHLDAPVSSTLRASLSSFTKLYADRFAADRIRMNCVLAGFVDTYPVPEKFAQAIPMAARRRSPRTSPASWPSCFPRTPATSRGRACAPTAV